jgi:hypothetical protein
VEEDNNKIISLINQLEVEIDIIINTLKQDKETLDKVKYLEAKLKEVEKILNPKVNTLRNELYNVNKILNELKNIKGGLILDDIGKIYENIRRNLLNGMDLIKTENNNDRVINFENKEVGKMKVLENNEPNVIIGVQVYDKTEEFEITDALRTYNIISFINTNFNYK